jgi:hypothetical protein
MPTLAHSTKDLGLEDGVKKAVKALFPPQKPAVIDQEPTVID